MPRISSSWSLQLWARRQARLAIRSQLPLHRQRPAQPRWFTQTAHVQDTSLAQSSSTADDTGVFDSLNISYEPYDGPVIRFEHHGGPSPEQKQALKHDLGVNALGKPADVFVFEPRQNKRKKHEFEASHAHVPSGEFDLDETEILKRIQDGIGIVDVKDALAHVDQVRADWKREREGETDYVSEDEYALLHQRLCKGFTKVQLQAYISQANSDVMEDEADLRHEYAGPFVTRSQWATGETSTRGSRAPPFAAKPKSSEPRSVRPATAAVLLKEDVAEKILDDIWRIQPSSRELEIGELDIRLRRIPFELLMRHTMMTTNQAAASQPQGGDNFLKTISEQYGVKIDAFPNEKVVRVTSTRDVCGDIFRLIKYKVSGIISRSWSITLLEPHHFSNRMRKALIQETERLTNTVVEVVSNQSGKKDLKLRIYYLESRPADFDAAAKFLGACIQRYGSRDLACIWAYYVSSTQITPSLVDVESKVPFIDRDESWIRWAYPSPLAVQGPEDSARIMPFASAPRHGAFRGINAIATPTNQFFSLKGLSLPNVSTSRQYWDTNVLVRREINYGQILSSMSSTSVARSLVQTYAEERGRANMQQNLSSGGTDAILDRAIQPAAENAEDGQTSTLLVPSESEQSSALDKQEPAERWARYKRLVKSLSKSDRIFLPLAGGMVAKMGRFENHTSRSEEISITLHPKLSPSISPSLLPHVPVLNIRLTASFADQTVKLDSARLVLQNKELGILCPGQRLDLMASYEVYVEAATRNIDPQIRRFITASNLDIWGNANLTTPDRLQLNIPTYAIKSTKLDRKTASDEEPSSSDPKLITVDYAFTSLECHSVIRTIYSERNSLKYSAIEAGRAGGRRDETTLSCTTSIPISRFAAYTKPNIKTPAARKLRAFQQSLSADLFRASMDLYATFENPTRELQMQNKATMKQEEARRDRYMKLKKQRLDRAAKLEQGLESENVADTDKVPEDTGAIKAIQDMYSRYRVAESAPEASTEEDAVEPDRHDELAHDPEFDEAGPYGSEEPPAEQHWSVRRVQNRRQEEKERWKRRTSRRRQYTRN